MSREMAIVLLPILVTFWGILNKWQRDEERSKSEDENRDE